jgi:hypothetical protein
LREAFEVVGQLTFGSAWDPTCIDRPKNEQHIACKNNLIAAFEDESVEVHKRDGDHRTPLKTSEIVGEFFAANLKTDRIYIDQTPGVDWECLTLERDLRRFIHRHDEVPQRGPAKWNAISEYARWLTNELKTNSAPSTRKAYAAAANSQHGISEGVFRKIWNEAKVNAGKSELGKAGRKKIPT